MFLLHDSTRRRMCRWAFLALGLLPLLVVCGWARWVQTESHRKSHEAALSQLVGARVSVEQVTLPTPNVTLYHQVTLADPESGSPVVRLPLVEVERHRETYDVIFSQPLLKADHLSTLAALVQRALRSELSTKTFVRCRANEIIVEMRDGAQTLVNVQSQFGSSAVGPEMRVDFHLAGVEMTEPLTLWVGRNRQVMPAASFLELNSKGGRLPCWLVRSFWPAAFQLGDDSQFSGTLWGTESPSGWQGEIDGKITKIDLKRLVTGQFPHHLSGVAEIEIRKAQFRHGRLEQGTAWFSAGPGMIGRSLITSAIGNLACESPADPSKLAPMISYEQLKLMMTFDSRGLVLEGRCATGGPGALLVDQAGMVLRTPQNLPQPAVNLVRTLVPQSEYLVPATRETDLLSRSLPIPRISVPLGKEPVPYVRAKLKEAR